MRSDAECRRAYLDRQAASLEQLPAAMLRRVMRGAGSEDAKFILSLAARYLGIDEPPPDDALEAGSLLGGLRARFWRPESPDAVSPVNTVINVGVELLASPDGTPRLLILPGPYPPVLHPHIVPCLPGGVCLMDDFRIDQTDLADIAMSLVRMLRFEEGSYSLSDADALALGVARWLREGALDGFDLPLGPPAACGVRILTSGVEGGAQHD
ncbi:MAG: hypothetical protein U9R79_03220 [Armatimonadota bacterium]|nr:hypothetical protein [Armatimonadota bacterium]